MTQTADTSPAGAAIEPARGTPDEARWPDVFAVPKSGLRAAIAWAVFSRAVARLPVLVRLPGGRHLGGGNGAAPEMVLHRPGDFCARVGASGLIGFGESYMAGDWDCADLTGLITVFARQVAGLVPRPLQRLRRVSVRRQPAAERSTLARARRNVSHHYDLSNELFALFLDETMTYSAALFQTGDRGDLIAGPNSLAAAQRRKIDRLLDQTRVGPGTRVLEIGTGWGELALRAAARGATVRTVTLSEQQRALAIGRIAAAGLGDRVSVELRDYRDVHGQYDAILSVEMIEAVGERYWPAYFETLDRLLAPGGRIGLQAITMAHDRMLATRDTYTWILKYIFPGGLIPSVTGIEAALARHTRLRVAGRLDFGPHYEQTLRLWRQRFTARRADLPGLGFDEVFARMWELYLSYSEAGFAASYLDVCQFLLERAR
ncbi:MAG TPA: cyclopropane-fatty-acyl-phospholipid synthase family protein [Streptosporangiaceae bacterium]|nr:cyclopropane-fatty-acyl-phospholipid synthase family protein [Streptosporangiaceae bacterium]